MQDMLSPYQLSPYGMSQNQLAVCKPKPQTVQQVRRSNQNTSRNQYRKRHENQKIPRKFRNILLSAFRLFKVYSCSVLYSSSVRAGVAEHAADSSKLHNNFSSSSHSITEFLQEIEWRHRIQEVFMPRIATVTKLTTVEGDRNRLAVKTNHLQPPSRERS